MTPFEYRDNDVKKNTIGEESSLLKTASALADICLVRAECNNQVERTNAGLEWLEKGAELFNLDSRISKTLSELMSKHPIIEPTLIVLRDQTEDTVNTLKGLTKLAASIKEADKLSKEKGKQNG